MEEIFVPASGMAMEEVLLVEWLKEPGEPVGAGEPVALVETDKSTVELSGQLAGRLSSHLVSAGARVRGGTTVAYLLAEGEPDPAAGHAAPEGSRAAGGVPPASRDAAAFDQSPQDVAGDGADRVLDGGAAASRPSSRDSESDPFARHPDGRYVLSPRQRREALLASGGASASAPGERLASLGRPGPSNPAPPASAAGPPPSPPPPPPPPPPAPSRPPGRPAGLVALAAARAESSNRRATAELVSESWRTMPHFSVGREVRAEALLSAVQRARAAGLEVTVTDFLLRAFGLALEDVGERADIGLAVATQWGVLIPVVSGVARASLAETVELRRAAVERARSRRLASGDGVAPFASLSNLGPDGVRWFNGVIPLGQCALLTVGRVGPRPAVEGRGLVVAQMFDAVVTADHRRYDGVDSARLLAGFAGHLGRAGAEEDQ